MPTDYLVRTTWRDPRDYVVHAVDVDCGVDPLVVGDLIRTQVVGAVGAWRTVCGEQMPRSIVLDPHEPVTCDACLAADGGPALAVADAILADARRAVPA